MSREAFNIPEWMQNARKGPSAARIGVIVKNRGRFFHRSQAVFGHFRLAYGNSYIIHL
jgi:hypothetical protein